MIKTCLPGGDLSEQSEQYLRTFHTANMGCRTANLWQYLRKTHFYIKCTPADVWQYKVSTLKREKVCKTKNDEKMSRKIRHFLSLRSFLKCYGTDSRNYYKKSGRMTIIMIGVGNGGCNILDDIQKDEYYAEATFVYCDDNTDDLNKHGKGSDCKLLLNMEQPNDFLFADESIDLTIIASALGGRTTSTFTAQITEACRKQSKMVLGAIAMPFATEGQQCVDTAKQVLEALKPLYDALFIQYNDLIPGNLLISDMNDPLCSGLKRLCLAMNESKVYDLNALSIADTIYIISKGLVIE